MGEERKPVDWESIEREFRAGVLSLRVIAGTHGVTEGAVRKRALRDGWQRALADKVRAEVREKLARLDGTQEGTQERKCKDVDIIEVASIRGAAVVEAIRKDLAQLMAMRRTIAERLEGYLAGRAQDKPFMGDKESPSDLLEKLSRIDARVIPLQRQAFNLDDPAPPPGAGNLNKLGDADLDQIEAILAKAGNQAG